MYIMRDKAHMPCVLLVRFKVKNHNLQLSHLVDTKNFHSIANALAIIEHVVVVAAENYDDDDGPFILSAHWACRFGTT